MDKKTIRRFQREADKETIVSFTYSKPDGSSARRNVMLQPPQDPHAWFDADVHVYGIDLDKGATTTVQVWRLDAIEDIVW